MRSPQNVSQSSIILQNDAEDSLYNFLEQLQTFIERDVDYVIGEIERRVEKGRNKRLGRYLYHSDVFLSYSRRDIGIVRRLKSKLEDRGLKVWFDKTDIPEGESWEAKIRKGIKNTRIFVPILSKNIEEEYMVPHEYRTEWNIACEIAEKMGGRKFIWPLAEKGFDFDREQTKLPKQIHDINASEYNIADDFSDFVEKIKETVEDLKLEESNNGNK